MVLEFPCTPYMVAMKRLVEKSLFFLERRESIINSIQGVW
jgi:hypothetical protein